MRLVRDLRDQAWLAPVSAGCGCVLVWVDGRVGDPFGCPDTHIGVAFPGAPEPGDEDTPAGEGDERRCVALSKGPAVPEYVFGSDGG